MGRLKLLLKDNEDIPVLLGSEQIPAVEQGEIGNQQDDDTESGVDEPPNEDIDRELEEFREVWKEELTGEGNQQDGEEKETSEIELEVKLFRKFIIWRRC